MTSLRKHLKSKVEEENNLCRQAKALMPCLVYSVYGRCRGCNRDHATTDPKSYNLRVKLHLQQIVIYQALHATEFQPLELRWQKSYVLANFRDIVVTCDYFL